MFRRGMIGLAALLVTNAAGLAQTPVQRGDYLVNSILTCGNCHTPKGPGGAPVTDKLHSGGVQERDEPTYKVKGANITPHKETGIGGWSDADIKRAMTEGVRPNGVPLAPIMPFAYYKIFTPGDLSAVVAYLKSVPPIHAEVQPPVYKAAMHFEVPPGAEKPMADSDLRDPVKRGFYLVTIGHCMECHTPAPNGRHDFKALGKGGQEFRGPWGVSISRNITSHPQKGIGAWSDDEIKRAITGGVSRDGSPLKPPMGYPWYARMTGDDLDAVVAYLRTVPPLE
jgi:mono/diheme cytochrome c family protein